MERLCGNRDCNKPIERKPNERPSEAAQRKFCNNSCRARASHYAAEERHNRVHKARCVVCNEPIIRRDDESLANCRARKTCGPLCNEVQQSRPFVRSGQPRVPIVYRTGADALLCLNDPPQRRCRAPGCGKPLERRDGEYPHQFRKRTTCGGPCMQALRSASLAAINKSGRNGPTWGKVQRANERAMQLVAEAPEERQVAAYLAAGEHERRLFEPHIAEAARKRAGHAVCLAVEGPPARDKAARGMDVAKRGGGAYATDCAEFRE